MAQITMDVTEYHRMLDLEKVLKQTIEDSDKKHKEIITLTAQLEEERNKSSKEILKQKEEYIDKLEKKSKGITVITKKTIETRLVNSLVTKEKINQIFVKFLNQYLNTNYQQFSVPREISDCIYNSIVYNDTVYENYAELTEERGLQEFKDEYFDKLGKDMKLKIEELHDKIIEKNQIIDALNQEKYLTEEKHKLQLFENKQTLSEIKNNLIPIIETRFDTDSWFKPAIAEQINTLKGQLKRLVSQIDDNLK